MRNLLNKVLLGCALAFSSVAYLGCETTQTVQETAAKSILTTQSLVNGYMSAFGDLVALNRVSIEDRVEVFKAYRDYKREEGLAIMTLDLTANLDLELTPEAMDDAFEKLIFLLFALGIEE